MALSAGVAVSSQPAISNAIAINRSVVTAAIAGLPNCQAQSSLQVQFESPAAGKAKLLIERAAHLRGPEDQPPDALLTRGCDQQPHQFAGNPPAAVRWLRVDAGDEATLALQIAKFGWQRPPDQQHAGHRLPIGFGKPGAVPPPGHLIALSGYIRLLIFISIGGLMSLLDLHLPAQQRQRFDVVGGCLTVDNRCHNALNSLSIILTPDPSPCGERGNRHSPPLSL